jgi:hypothetical protein
MSYAANDSQDQRSDLGDRLHVASLLEAMMGGMPDRAAEGSEDRT